ETRIRESLAEMAKPFEDRAQELASMIAAESEKLTDESLKSEIKSWVVSSDTLKWTSSSAAKADGSGFSKTEAMASKKALIEKLHQNPKDTAVLAGLMDHYKSIRNDRLAYYFEGRIKQVSQEVSV